jgi:hypothetical protein
LRIAKLLVVEAMRLIKAAGFRVMPNDPLEFSSARVQSVFPDSCDLRCGEMRASDAPVWIVVPLRPGDLVLFRSRVVA